VTYKYLLNERIDRNVLSVLIGNDTCGQPFNAAIFNTTIETDINSTMEMEDKKSNDSGLKAFAKDIRGCKFTGGEEIFQITPEYFRCRNDKGSFSKKQFIQNACLPEKKMIELDLSGTAKARHQDFSNCKVGKTTRMNPRAVFATLGYREFAEAESMLHFVDALRAYSDAKPVGVKLCVDKKEFHEICYAIRKTEIFPDFIVIEGNRTADNFFEINALHNARMPLYEALLFASKTLQTYGLEKHIKIIASANVVSAFDVLKILALGADMVYSAMPGCSINYYGRSRLIKPIEDAVEFQHNILSNIVTIMEACAFRSVHDLTLPNFLRKLHELQVAVLQVPDNALVSSNWQNVS
jgi:hypothetical protein